MVKLNIIALAVTMTSTLISAADFHYRFYRDDNGCNQNAVADATFPPNNQRPYDGNAYNCYSAPRGTDWKRLEIDKNFHFGTKAVVTYYDPGCGGGRSGYQFDTYCYQRIGSCAIGSFRVEEVPSNEFPV